MLQTKKLHFHLYLYCILCDKVFLLISQIKSQKLAGTGDLLSPFLPYCPVIMHCIIQSDSCQLIQLIKPEISVASEKAMAPHSSTLAWKIPWTEEPGRLQSMGVTTSQTRLSNFTFTFHFHAFGEGNGNPLQCSCLENPRDGGSMVGCRLWGRTESDTTEATQQKQQLSGLASRFIFNSHKACYD